LPSSFLLFSSSRRNTASRAASTSWRACHRLSRPAGSQSAAATASSLTAGPAALTAVRTASMNALSANSLRLPSPTSSTRPAATPGRARSVTVAPRLPVTSPLFTAARSAPFEAASIARACALSSPSANTPTATQSVLTASAAAVRLLNSMVMSRLSFVMVGRQRGGAAALGGGRAARRDGREYSDGVRTRRRRRLGG
jgi:hypothetical protein